MKWRMGCRAEDCRENSARRRAQGSLRSKPHLEVVQTTVFPLKAQGVQ